MMPSSDLPQRRPQARTLKRAGLLRMSICPGWGIMHCTVVDLFDSVGLFVGVLEFLFQIFNVFLQYLCSEVKLARMFDEMATK